MKKIASALFAVALAVGALGAQAAAAQPVRMLFIGNSFTYGAHSAAQWYGAAGVHDLNPPDRRGRTIGGVPGIFKAFTAQAGLDYDVSLETEPGKGLDFHIAERRALIDKPWDVVMMHGYSTLDQAHPGDPGLLIATTRDMTNILRSQNPSAKIYLMASWSRADMTYPAGTPWYGKPIQQMGRDVDAAYQLAMRGAPGVTGVAPVGLAFNRAIDSGVADDNPYDDLGASKIDLWTYDHYHASSAGYYLEALVDFGEVTGLDPLMLNPTDYVAEDLGLSPQQSKALQQIAHDELIAHGLALADKPPLVTPQPIPTVAPQPVVQ
jgi:hypothetical protein